MTASTPSAIANARFVPLKDLVIEHPLWTNPRTVTGLSDEEIADLGSDIKHRGIQVPLHVQKIWAKAEGGEIINLVLDGQRRYLAGREALSKDTEIPVVDRTAQPIVFTPEVADTLMLDMLAVAAKREGLSSVELSEIAERLRNRGRKLSDIAKAIGKNEGWISKILKARSAATPKLLLRWRKGELTDEQFKDLAEVKDKETQENKVDEVIKARQSGDKAEARTIAKEIKETAKRTSNRRNDGEEKLTKFGERMAAESAGNSGKNEPRAVTGEQAEMFEKPKAAPTPPPAKPKKPMTARIALEGVLELADKRAPTHDYVKGIMDGIAFALGDKGPSDWGKAWRVYLARVEGSGKPTKKVKTKAKGKAAKTKKPAAKKKAAKKRGK